jgi:hypothetical protein
MKTAFKISGLLIGFLLFLSITVNNKPIFHHVYNVISPATIYAQNATAAFFDRSVNSTETYSKKLFDNSVPKLKDSVDSKLASTLKKAAKAEPEEKIMESEKRELDQLIKNH